MLRFWLVIVMLCGLGACTHAFKPRAVPGCYLSAGAPKLDRERSYYALLLALSERNYEIFHAELPRQVEVAYHSDYAPERGLTLIIDVRQDAVLAMQSIPAAVQVGSKQERMVEQLTVSLRRFMCRDLNWLRWEAQNRGLAPMAVAAGDFGAGGESVGGAAQPAAADVLADPRPAGSSPAAAPPAPQLSVSAPAVAAQIAELRRQRDQLSLRMPAALWITGGALAVATVGLAIPGGIALFNDCDYDDDCGNERGRNLLIAAGSVAAAAAAFGISGMVLFGQRKRRLLRIRQELLQLTAPVVSVGGSFDRRGVNLSLRATF